MIHEHAFPVVISVIPESPHDIVATHTTPSTTMLTWSIGPMAYFPEELVHKIEFKSRLNARNEVRRVSVDHRLTDENINVYSCVCFSQTLKFAGRPDCNSSSTANQVTSYFQKSSECHMAFNVTGLRHPFADYDFHIYVRTSSARGEDKWSAPGSVTVKTKPTSKIIHFTLVIRSDVASCHTLILYCVHRSTILRRLT